MYCFMWNGFLNILILTMLLLSINTPRNVRVIPLPKVNFVSRWPTFTLDLPYDHPLLNVFHDFSTVGLNCLLSTPLRTCLPIIPIHHFQQQCSQLAQSSPVALQPSVGLGHLFWRLLIHLDN